MSTDSDRQRIDLNSLFQTVQKRMIAELAGLRETVNHGGTLGDETELAWRNFLSRNLPNRYQVCDGFVVDANGFRSDQMDVIVFDRQYSPPLFTGGSVQYVPAEAVYAVFEVKQRIDQKICVWLAPKQRQPGLLGEPVQQSHPSMAPLLQNHCIGF